MNTNEKLQERAKEYELLQLAIMNLKFYHGHWADYEKERKAVHLKYRGQQ
jgi:hypothetical protein